MAEQGQNSRLAVWSLLAGALTWGVLWYPYRVLASQGVGGVLASVLTYAVALALALLIWHRQLGPVRPSGLLLAIGLSGAACNLGYVLATLHGEVMRVLLLFYLAPLWTVLLARLWLGERLNRVGAGVVALSIAGAATMLWHPELGLPWPKNGAEWLGLGAGVLFACANVLSRKAESVSIAQKSTAIFAGAVVLGGLLLLLGVEPWAAGSVGANWGLLLGVGVVLLVINMVVQFGLGHSPANRAIVILLSELVFAALASWILAGEMMGLREWLGGGMIAAASLFSARVGEGAPA